MRYFLSRGALAVSSIGILLFTSFTVCAATASSRPSYAEQGKTQTQDWARRDQFVNPEEIGETIVESWDGGSWEYQGVTGIYRFVITHATVADDQAGANLQTNKLYVQWMLQTEPASDTNPEGLREVSYSMSVRELNEFPVYQFSIPQCSDGCEQARVVANHVYEQRESQFTLSFPNIGEYNFKPSH
jgi:hypothetical protein